MENYKKLAAEIRKTILLGMSYAHAGHVGGSMSMADLLAVPYMVV